MAAEVLIVRVRPGETRICALDADRRLIDFALYRDTASQALGGALGGDVFVGRVKKVSPALQAAFVDIGAPRNGFLALAEARPQPHAGGGAARDRISDYVHEGEALMVQVMAEARDDKGAKLTRRVNVAGTLCVLTPGDPGVRVSKRVRDAKERKRLCAALSGMLEDGQGGVVRSAAVDASDEALRRDISALQGRWDALRARAAAQRPPVRLSEDPVAVLRYLDENGSAHIDKIVIDDPALARNLKDVLPGVEPYAGREDIFRHFGISDEVAALCEPCVGLKSGGSIIIEQTAALTTIDVNAGASGKGMGALATNLEAVHEAARQMRLRNLCGLIVIDLMPMRGTTAAGRVVTALKDAQADDPAGPYVLGTTRGGLLEVTRPRRRAPLAQHLLTPCPTCAGLGGVASPLTVGLRALESVMAEVRANPALIPALYARSAVIMALRTDVAGALGDMNEKLGHTLKLVVDDTLKADAFQVQSLSGKR